MAIDNKKNDYSKWLNIWEKTRDAIAGQEAVKIKSTKYLPKLPGQPDDAYTGYLERAQFINFTNRTLQTALGQIFRKKPLIKGADSILDLLDNIDLSGRNIDYFAREVISDILAVNRAGVSLDYSEFKERPYLVFFPAETIINWRMSNINGESKLSLLVVHGISEQPSQSDPYKTEIKDTWKEFYLDSETGFYCVRDWIKVGSEFIPSDVRMPLMNGKPFDYIPFFVLSTNSIDYNIVKAPLLDFVNLNFGHYKNDADYENMIHLCGCKTVIAKGWGETPFPMGGCANFGIDGDAHFLEASADSALLEELRHKEEQMAILGSSLLSGKGRYVAAAETQRLQSEGEYATLADVSNAASLAFTKILKIFAEWNGTPCPNLTIEFNTDFETSELNPQELMSFMGAVQSGLMSFDTYFYNLKNKEVYPAGWTEEDEEKAIEETMKKTIESRGGLSESINLQDDSSNA